MHNDSSKFESTVMPTISRGSSTKKVPIITAAPETIPLLYDDNLNSVNSQQQIIPSSNELTDFESDTAETTSLESSFIPGSARKSSCRLQVVNPPRSCYQQRSNNPTHHSQRSCERHLLIPDYAHVEIKLTREPLPDDTWLIVPDTNNSSIDHIQANGINHVRCTHCGCTQYAPLKLTIHTDKVVNIESASTKSEHSQEKRKISLRSSLSSSSVTRNANFVQYIMNIISPSDNKLSMKLFGSRRAVMMERKRQEKEGRFIIHPCSTFRFYWDLMMLTLLLANVILLPLAIAFFHAGGYSKGSTTFNLISDTLFLFDIILNFRTGVIINNYVDEIILNPRQIAIHYAKGWFLIDVLSSFPVDYIFFILENKGNRYQIARTGRAIKAIRLFRLLSLLRLLRVSRLVRYATQWEEEFRSFFSVASIAMRIFNLIGLIMLIAHWNGCLQFLVPLLQDFPADSWVAMNHLQNETWTKQYTLALFKALSHMLSIGYGRFPPQSYTDMWLTMLSMIVGAIVYATTIGHVSALVQSFDTSGRLYNDKVRQVEEYMMWRKLPRQLRSRIMDYYEHRFQGKMFNEPDILKELSAQLYLDVVNHNCRALVSSVPFFTNADPNFVNDIITKLEFEMYQPGDIVISENTVGDKMYFIQEGIVDIVKSDGEILTTLSDGSYFGEISLILKTRRTAEVKAITYCNLYSLSAVHLDNILKSFPAVKRTIEIIATQRLTKLGKDMPISVQMDTCLAEDVKILKNIFRAQSPKNLDSMEKDVGEDQNSLSSNDSVRRTDGLPGSIVRNRSSHVGLSSSGIGRGMMNMFRSSHESHRARSEASLSFLETAGKTDRSKENDGTK